MKWRTGGIIFLLLFLLGCGTSQYQQAEKLMKQEDYKEAIRAYVQMLDPHVRNNNRYIYYDKEAVTGIGVAYWHMDKFSTAQKVLERVITKDPYYAKAQFYLGLCYESLFQEDKALQVYRRFTRIPDSDPYKQLMIGRLDWLIRKRVTQDVQNLIAKEKNLNLDSYPKNSVGVLYFISQSTDPRWLPLQKGLAEMINTDLAVADNLVVVERLHLNLLMQEKDLSVKGLSQSNNAEMMGKLLGARTLVKGSYLITPDLKMTVDAGIYDADRPDFPLPASYEGTLATLFQMEKELVIQILDYFGIEISIEQREKIFKIPTTNMDAFLNYCLGLDALDRDNYDEAQNYFMESVRLDPDFGMARNKLVSRQAWDLTHIDNLIRLEHDAQQYVDNMPRGGPEMLIQPKEGLVTPWKRLQVMAVFQNAGFLPGSDTRDGFIDPDTKAMRILPEKLGLPVNPGK